MYLDRNYHLSVGEAFTLRGLVFESYVGLFKVEVFGCELPERMRAEEQQGFCI